MTWITLVTGFKKAYIWLKHHWQLPFLVVWTIVVFVLTRRNSDAIIEVLKAKKTSYEQQIGTLRASHTEELLKRNQLLEQYQETLSKIEKKFAEEEMKLDEEERQLVREIVARSKGDPDVIRKEIENLFYINYAD